ncbi:hypothetical protein C0989_004804, partial [Termitomyces sp. Mn162]
VVHGGGGGFSGGPEADQVLSHVAKGGEHGAVCQEGGAFTGWLGKGGVLGGDLWEVSSLPTLGGGTQQEAAWVRVIGVPPEWSSSPPMPIPSITEVFLCKQVEALTTSLAVQEGELQQAREDRDVVRMEKEAMEQERNTLVRVVTEQALEVRGLREHLTQMEGQPTGKAEGRGQVPEGDALWVELEAARQRKDWLANKAASGHAGILRELPPVPPFITDGSFSGFRLGVGALGPLGRCLCSICVDSGQVDAGVCGSASGVAAGDGAIGEVVGGASATQCGGPGVMVGGGG